LTHGLPNSVGLGEGGERSFLDDFCSLVESFGFTGDELREGGSKAGGTIGSSVATLEAKIGMIGAA